MGHDRYTFSAKRVPDALCCIIVGKDGVVDKPCAVIVPQMVVGISANDSDCERGTLL